MAFCAVGLSVAMPLLGQPTVRLRRIGFLHGPPRQQVVQWPAAFRTPQVALFGPTNPFHWRPRHERAVVLSAAQPDAPLTIFTPRMKGVPMERISTELVIGAIAQLIPTP